MPANHPARVRAARIDDAEAIGRCHVRAWKAGYRGHMPDDFLDDLDETLRGESWRGALEAGGQPGEVELAGNRAQVLVVEDESGQVRGVATVGAARDQVDGPAGIGELWMINLEPEAWGLGLGTSLLAGAAHELRRLGYHQAYLWVLDGNGRARRFYEREGWTTRGEQKTDVFGGREIVEVRYWLDL